MMSSEEAEYAMAAVVKPRKVRVKEPPVAAQVSSCCSLYCSPSGSFRFQDRGTDCRGSKNQEHTSTTTVVGAADSSRLLLNHVRWYSSAAFEVVRCKVARRLV